MEPDVLSSVAARDWAPGCVPGGVWATSLPCLLFIPSWADPSMGMLTWSLHWASRARGGVGPTPPSGRWTGCPLHRPHPLGNSAMIVTVSQPCLEFSKLGLASMAAASARSNFCFQQRHVSAQIPTREEGDPPEGVRPAWAASTAWTLPIPPSQLSPGVWTQAAHGLLTHIRLVLLEADTPQEAPIHAHRERTQDYVGGMGEGTWPGLVIPCYLPVPSGKGPEASRRWG